MDFIAMTDNDVVTINAGHPLVTKNRDRTARYTIILGLFTHELGHILYTDFLMQQTYALRMQVNTWYPAPPLPRNSIEEHHEAELWDYCKQNAKKRTVFLRMAHNIYNILEDGFIESKMLDRYPGKLGMSLKEYRDTTFERCPTLTQLIEMEDEPGGHIWTSILQLLLSYMLWGELKYGDEPLSDERVQVIFSLLPELDKALTNPDPKERLRVTNTILIRCWPYIKGFLEMAEELAEQATASGTGSGAEDELSKLLSQLVGTSATGSGNGTPIAEASGSSHRASSAAKRAATAVQAASAASSGAEEEETAPGASAGDDADAEKDDAGSTPAAGKGDDPNSDSEEDKTDPAAGENDDPYAEEDERDSASIDEDDDSESDDPESASENEPNDGESFVMDSPGESQAQDISAEESGRIPLRDTTTLSAPVGGERKQDDAYEGSGYTNAAAGIARVLDQMAERAVCNELEKQRTNELNALAGAISYGDIHSGVAVTVHRMAAVSDEMKEQYAAVAPPLLKISARLQKSILQQLQDKRRGGKQTNLYSGRKLYVHALPRNDGRAFYNKKLPNDTPTLAIALLDDESGSMCCGDRATYARAMSIILYDFCQSLGIPIMIYGHSTGHNTVDLYSYAEFDAIDRDDKYRLMDISARGSNRDGAALRFVMEQLAKCTADIRLLILISDGQPADYGYSGTAAEADLRGIKKDCERKGIHLIAAAIGEDKVNIERIYGDSFLDITDLEKMPRIPMDQASARQPGTGQAHVLHLTTPK